MLNRERTYCKKPNKKKNWNSKDEQEIVCDGIMTESVQKNGNEIVREMEEVTLLCVTFIK